MISGKLLIANRGEIATRISRTAAEFGLATVAVFPDDDATSLHTQKTDEAVRIAGRGVSAYLNGDTIINAALDAGADAIHPGYGFLSENAHFAQSCVDAGIIFVGPAPQHLSLFGDKHAARQLANEQHVPILPGTASPTSLNEARSFMDALGPNGAVMIKAVSGGGGRGMRSVSDADALAETYERCQSEALAAFGNGELYVERLVRNARHIEVQIIGDGLEVSHLWERDCSLQRRRQKVVEFAPAPHLDPSVREQLIDASLRLADAVNYRNLGTIEFLVDQETNEFYFIEANPRLQVEHTVTEEVTGLDLVELQLQISGGSSLADLDLTKEKVPMPRGTAMQLRINTETMLADGSIKPSGGYLTAFEAPSGRGIRVDSYGYPGYATNPAYDSLLAKLIVHASSNRLTEIMNKGYRSLCEFKIAGVPTNLEFLQNLLNFEGVREGKFDTSFIENNVANLVGEKSEKHPHHYFFPNSKDIPESRQTGSVGVKVDAKDPLAVLNYGKSELRGDGGTERSPDELDEGLVEVRLPMQGTIVSLSVVEGDTVSVGGQVAVIEAMKMEHVIASDTGGTVRAIYAGEGDTLWEGQVLMGLEPSAGVGETAKIIEEIDLDEIRSDLAEVLDNKSLTSDENRPDAVSRRRKTNQRTARENIENLVDPGSFIEYGPLVVAAQRQRRGLEDLLTRSPADGLITGVGKINGELFDETTAGAAIMAYDYTVFAGTQGVHNHWKTDRLLDISEQGRMPMIVFAEGGGGRPGDTDYGGFVGQNTFHHFGQLSGLVPLISIVSGRCFAGNAALLGCCDVIIATKDSNIGMGGPAMVEGGGLGVFAPEDIGPIEVQTSSGVVDIAVEDEEEAVAVAKRYLSFFQGNIGDWREPDQRLLRSIVPENRLRVYEVRRVIETLADEGSVLELRREFGRTMVTALGRIEGKPIGIIANDPRYLGGAIDSDGSDKGARFMQLCDAFDIPVLNLCDTPGIMVGPEVEKTALVRHAARLFLIGCNLSVPYFTVVLRKAYGLGAIGMAGGHFRAPYFSVAWPTGEFGPMGLEGQVKLGYRAELAAMEDPKKRKQLYEELVANSYEEGKALSRSRSFAIDDTIDPSETRRWLVGIMSSIRPPAPRDGKKRTMIDAW